MECFPLPLVTLHRDSLIFKAEGDIHAVCSKYAKLLWLHISEEGSTSHPAIDVRDPGGSAVIVETESGGGGAWFTIPQLWDLGSFSGVNPPTPHPPPPPSRSKISQRAKPREPVLRWSSQGAKKIQDLDEPCDDDCASDEEAEEGESKTESKRLRSIYGLSPHMAVIAENFFYVSGLMLGGGLCIVAYDRKSRKMVSSLEFPAVSIAEDEFPVMSKFMMTSSGDVLLYCADNTVIVILGK